MRIVIGIIMVIAGTLLAIFKEQMYRIVGRIGWAEDKFGIYGGTRTFWVFLGIATIFVGFLVIFNFYEGILRWLLSPIIR